MHKAKPAWIYVDEINLTWIDYEPVITVALREIMIPFTYVLVADDKGESPCFSSFLRILLHLPRRQIIRRQPNNTE